LWFKEIPLHLRVEKRDSYPVYEKATHQPLLRTAVLKLLRPIVNLLIKQEISCSEFNEIAKEPYVTVADNDFIIPNRKKTFSRAAVLTGLSRKEVVRLLKGTQSKLSPPRVRINTAARVVTGGDDKDFIRRGRNK
jgi:hypothetical protein